MFNELDGAPLGLADLSPLPGEDLFCCSAHGFFIDRQTGTLGTGFELIDCSNVEEWKSRAVGYSRNVALSTLKRGFPWSPTSARKSSPHALQPNRKPRSISKRNGRRLLPQRQHLRDRKVLEDRARKCCADGLRVLAYLATVDGRRSPDEHNIEISVIESRLIASGFERDSEILAMLADQAAALSVTKNALTRSVKALGDDESYFRLVYDAAMIIAHIDKSVDDAETEVIQRLEKVRRAKGWF